MWRSAAEQGHVSAQYNLGFVHAQGQGVKQDFTEAVRWTRMAAEQGLAQAQFNLSLCYEHGQGGVKQNNVEAARWCRKAAEQDLTQAQFNLGVIYYKGEGVKQDFAEAAKCFRKAAEQGYAEAEGNALIAEEELRKHRRDESHLSSKPHASPVVPIPCTSKCANCGNAGTAGSSVALKPCSRCKAVVYCGKACQAQHWKTGRHREVCK